MFIEAPAPPVQPTSAARPPPVVPTKLRYTSWVPFWSKKTSQCDHDFLDDELGHHLESTTSPLLLRKAVMPRRKKQVSTHYPRVNRAMLTRFLVGSPTLLPACSPPFMLNSPRGRPFLSSILSSIQTLHWQPYLFPSRSRACPATTDRSSFIEWRKLSGQRMTVQFG
jgi:hypothetical protein